MASSALMSLGMRAMNANYAALQATGHNIANANTPGYSRQSALLETAGGQFTGAGFFGKGVNVTTVERAHSDFLTREAATTSAISAGDEARSRQLQALEKVFGTGEAGVGYAANQMFNAFVDVAAKPQDASARQVVLARASELAARFRSAGEQIDSIAAGVTLELRSDVASVNTLAQQVADLNKKISAVKGSGQAPNDLLDQRDAAIHGLSQFMQVTTVAADDGSMSVFIGGGQRLVLGEDAVKLTAMQDEFDPMKVRIGIGEANAAPRPMPQELFTGGALAGLLRFQNSDIPAARNVLGQLAGAIAGRVNEQQALGLDLGQPAGAGAAIFSTGKAFVAASSNNAMSGGVPIASYIDGSGARVPSVGLTVVTPSELQASDYQLFADPSLPAGSYQLTRLSDGSAQTVSNGTLVDGFRVDVTTPAPVAGDSFLLQPVASAARNLQTVLADPKGIAAASPVNATVAVTNQGTATVASLRAASTALNPNLAATISFSNSSGAYSYTLVDTTGVLPTTSGTGTWTAGAPIALNGFELQLNGVPRSGDSLTVQKTAFSAADNGNANALLALRDAAIVGQRTLTNGTVVPGSTVTDAYADVLANVGIRVQGAKLSADQSSALAADAKAQQDAKSGVNLDEEAARLIQFQQSYQAAAKMLQVAQQIFDTLLQTAGR
jgi:flagellar hook-associated protein 1